ncbi:MAG: sigma-70 family RNA polymerase sigma factor [Gammaproteobacteria bacterium]|nr:sigma-70 family RNA polymerase sigma factor [Gammaproteobacteria bacterium]MCP5459204.1 sigma-70 family RNA polymerase sigma factor [Gammaproteobacteria bacterium]
MFQTKLNFTAVIFLVELAFMPSSDLVLSSQDVEEHELIRRVAEHDRTAFERLYRHYVPRLGRYLNKYLQQRELVEEVVNDVMLVLWQNAARFEPATARLSTWIFGIAHNKARKAYARAGRHPTEPLPEDLEDLHNEAEPTQDLSTLGGPEQDLLSEDARRVLRQALEKLSPEQRAVVELTYFEGFAYQEIAAITGSNVNTVKSRMFHARKQLALLLAS